jgi:23S rRNA (uracil1939-C5)-methyltransferase
MLRPSPEVTLHDEIDVEWLLPDGRVAGRGPEGTVTVSGALPGDRIRWREVRRQGRTVIGECVDTVRPSPDSRVPPCAYSSRCGGCDLDRLTPDAQRRAKAVMVQFALRLQDPPQLFPSPRDRSYRARVKLGVRDGVLGLHAARSHDILPVTACSIARDEVSAMITALQQWWTASCPSGIDEIEVRSDGQRVVLAVSGQPDAQTRSALSAFRDVAVNGTAIHGDPTLTLTGLGSPLRVSPRSFYQINLEMNEILVRWVVDRLNAVRAERVLDLYSGIGNFTLPIASHTDAHVVAVESEGQAVADLQFNAATLGLTGRVQAHVRPVERFDTTREAFDAVVLDPPRAGAPGVMERLVHNRPRRIVYIACHPPSAQRDLKAAIQAGYVVTEVAAFDMFPDTHHVETAIVLDRKPSNKAVRTPSRRR